MSAKQAMNCELRVNTTMTTEAYVQTYDWTGRGFVSYAFHLLRSFICVAGVKTSLIQTIEYRRLIAPTLNAYNEGLMVWFESKLNSFRLRGSHGCLSKLFNCFYTRWRLDISQFIRVKNILTNCFSVTEISRKRKIPRR